MNEKNEAPIVGRTVSENEPPRFLRTSDVLPTPGKREGEERLREGERGEGGREGEGEREGGEGGRERGERELNKVTNLYMNHVL